MLTYTGKHNSANVMIDDIDETTVTQIYSFLNHPAFGNTYIAIMPDCHAGAGAVIGYTAKMNSYVIPNVVGVDIGCGIEAFNLGQIEVDFAKLDVFIRENIPSGFHIRDNEIQIDGVLRNNIQKVCICCGMKANIDRVLRSIGTLGGGNHFIELDKDAKNNLWLIVHSGSRKFGLDTAVSHQQRAKELMIEMFLGASAYKDLEFLPIDKGGQQYLDDMKVAQEYAAVNRYHMARIIIEEFFKQEYSKLESVKSVHNYINFSDNILRKGAISAHEGERVIIPLNMRDGTIIGTGKGSAKWNMSAPHGAGRIYSRSRAKRELQLDEFQKEMVGVWSSCVSKDTLDESPMAYKDKQKIIDAIGESVTIDFIMKPVYNFKAVE
jgi:RNA-splicing ligase RtcB